ncbi:MAG: Gfo/Idh/MocA family oxidoreductase, partial [Planctomycetaceae bacterium]
MTHTTGTTRREFLQTSAAVGTAFWVTSQQESWTAPKAANEKIRFACIGVGGKGGSDSNSASRHGDVVAICDVDDNTLNKAGGRFKQAKKFNDYRVMLEKMADSIDAVTVSIPDHNHAAASAMAIKLGKHCFTQKPLTHSIYEARQLGVLAKKHKVQTQMGNQGTATSSLREGAAIVQSGVLGQIKEVHVWTNRPVWPQGGPRPKPSAVPKHLHWDIWLGPAPERPFGKGYHPFSWRGWWDFGTGALGDMACHTMNMPFMALNL